MADNRDADERQPLLGRASAAPVGEAVGGSPEVSPASSPSPPSSASSPPSSSFVSFLRQYVHIPHFTNRHSVTIQMFLCFALTELGYNTLMPALISSVESLLCQRILVADDPTLHLSVVGSGGGGGGIFAPNPLANDPRCKANAVQHELSRLSGWLTSLECIPGIVLAIPYGVMADKIGRRPVILLAWLGLTLQTTWYLLVLALASAHLVSPWAILFSAAIGCIGNFAAVGPAMVYTMLGDVTPQADRAGCYFRLQAAFLVAELISNPLGGSLLLVGNWTPLLVGYATMVTGFVLLLLFVPETLNWDQAADGVRAADKTLPGATDPDSSRRRRSIGDMDNNNNNHNSAGDLASFPSSSSPPKTSSWASAAWSGFVHYLENDAYELWTFVLTNRRLMVLMVSFTFLIAGRLAQDLLLQYATKRYHLSWSSATFLLTIRSVTNLVLCLVILPAVSVFAVRKLGLAPLFKDLWLARLSSSLFVVGALLTAFSPTVPVLSFSLVVSSLGGGYSSFMRSLLNAFVEAHHQAIMNSLLALIEFSGVLVAAPLMYKMLSTGIDLGGVWIGLPFMVAAGMFAIGNLLVWAFQISAAMVDTADRASSATDAGEGEEEEGVVPAAARTVDQEDA